jgi:hypothetical protein
MKRSLLVVALCLLGGLAWSSVCADDIAAKPGDSYQVPYRLSDVKHVVVRVKINGKGPFNFIVDTGAPAVYVGTEVAKKLDLKTEEDGKWDTLETLEIEGGPKLTKFKARVEDPFQLTGMNKMNVPGIRYHGVLGYTFLAQYEIEYDFARPHLKWTRLDWKPPAPVGLGSLSKGATDEMKKMVGFSMFATALIAKKPEATYIFRGLVGVEVEEKDGKVVVKKVLPESPAERGGMKGGDVIVQFRDKEITKLADLEKVAAVAADKEVEVMIDRSGSRQTIRLTTTRGF